MTPDRAALLVTCEHGGAQIPPECAPLFEDCADLLASHRGWDPGALPLARLLADDFDAPLIYSETSRLVVDLNRSIWNEGVFSPRVRTRDDAFLAGLLRDHYVPYRSRVFSEVQRLAAAGRAVVHLAVHTFTPELNGVRREALAGVLYDPARPAETSFADAFVAQLTREIGEPARHNYPYLGVEDGLTPRLRGLFPPDQYLGIELELNHGPWLAAGGDWQGLDRKVSRALRTALEAPFLLASGPPAPP